jgi:hypothetical protein
VLRLRDVSAREQLFIGGRILSKSLTEHALATIASILDKSESHRATQKPVPEEKAATLVPADADGYFKLGPGPMEAIRFKWTVRRAENGDYFVEETIGENSPPVVSGRWPWKPR